MRLTLDHTFMTSPAGTVIPGGCDETFILRPPHDAARGEKYSTCPPGPVQGGRARISARVPRPGRPWATGPAAGDVQRRGGTAVAHRSGHSPRRWPVRGEFLWIAARGACTLAS